MIGGHDDSKGALDAAVNISCRGGRLLRVCYTRHMLHAGGVLEQAARYTRHGRRWRCRACATVMPPRPPRTWQWRGDTTADRMRASLGGEGKYHVLDIEC